MLQFFHKCYSSTVHPHYFSHGTDTVAAKKLEEGTVTSRDTIGVSHPLCLPWYKCLTKVHLCLEELTVHRRQNTKERGICSNAVPCPASHNRPVEEPRLKSTDNTEGSRPYINEEAKHLYTHITQCRSSCHPSKY